MVIVDTSVMVDYLAGRRNPQTEWLNQNIGSQRIGITSLIFSEILQGIRSDRLFAETLNALEQLAIFDAGSKNLAITSAINYRKLRRMGITIRSLIDSFTATFCIQQGHELLHKDRDFDPFEEHLGLRVLDAQARLQS